MHSINSIHGLSQTTIVSFAISASVTNTVGAKVSFFVGLTDGVTVGEMVGFNVGESEGVPVV